MNIIKLLVASTAIAFAPIAAQAESVDIIGGPDMNAQTIHHCGFLPTTAKRYTSSPTTIRIVESKLYKLGYTRTMGDGVYNKKDKKAVRKFQRDNGLRVDGIVGPMTAQKLAFVSHPSANVHRCYRVASDLR